MALYPSLEDMKVDQLARAQMTHIGYVDEPSSGNTARRGNTPTAPPPYSLHPTEAAGTGRSVDSKYAHLYPTLNDYMGLDISPQAIQEVLGSDFNPDSTHPPSQDCQQLSLRRPAPVSVPQTHGLVAPLSGNSVGLRRGHTTHGVRELILCKDTDGRVGLRVHAMNKGVFVVLVSKDSPAALSGLRFGDQILQINGENTAGYSMEKVHTIFRKADNNGIVLAVRDRPFERSVTLHKDSVGHVGFQFKETKITAIVKDSSAARNGLLTDHNVLEVNGQNIVGLSDKEIAKVIDQAGDVVTVTIIPSMIYEHMMKSMGSSLKKKMDHSSPDL